jgi:hypothetical protein
MRIKYHTTEDDFVAFNVFHLRHSSYAKRTRIIAGISLPGLLLILVSSHAIYSHDWTYIPFAILVFGALFLWLLAGREEQAKRMARKFFREGENKGFIGIHELEIGDYGIFVKSEYGEGKIAWAVIERIASTPDYTFIFTGALTALLLPKIRVIEGDYDAFVAELTSRFTKSSSQASPEIKKSTILIDPMTLSYEDTRAGKHSGYGMASFITALILIASLFLSFTAALIIAILLDGDAEKDGLSFVIFAIVSIFALLAAFIGAGLGILGLLNKKRKKVFAIIGLILNLLIIFGFTLAAMLARS